MRAQLDSFSGAACEDVCREAVWRLVGRGSLDVLSHGVGRWRHGREQIDGVAVGDSELLVGECEWTARPVGRNVLKDVKREATVLASGEPPAATRYALFARSGFTLALEAQAATEGVLLVSLDDLTD